MSDVDNPYEQYEAYNRDSVYEQYTETKGEKKIETVSQEQNTYEVPYNDQIYTEYIKNYVGESKITFKMP